MVFEPPNKTGRWSLQPRAVAGEYHFRNTTVFFLFYPDSVATQDCATGRGLVTDPDFTREKSLSAEKRTSYRLKPEHQYR